MNRPMHIQCQQCGVIFKRPAGALKRQFCSRDCRTASRRTDPLPEPRECAWCRGSFTPTYKKRDQQFCKLACQRAARTASGLIAAATDEARAKLAESQRGRGEGKTYPKRGGRHEHRIVAEQAIGRALLPGEVVHHLDGNIRNNDPNNLLVLKNQAAHAKEHARLRRVRKGGDALCPETE